jgi:hypothetical protein
LVSHEKGIMTGVDQGIRIPFTKVHLGICYQGKFVGLGQQLNLHSENLQIALDTGFPRPLENLEYPGKKVLPGEPWNVLGFWSINLKLLEYPGI